MKIPRNETEWQQLVTDEAVKLGWEWFHVGRVGKHKANGAKGTLGKGWPDLVLLRPGRMVFAELKADDAPDLTAEQKLVLSALGSAGAETYVWRPSDLPHVLHVLNGH